MLVGGVAAAGEVVFDRDGEVGESAVALDLAEPGYTVRLTDPTRVKTKGCGSLAL